MGLLALALGVPLVAGFRQSGAGWGGIYGGAVTALVFLGSLRGGCGFYAPFGVTVLVALVLGGLLGETQPGLLWVGLVASLLTLDGLRERSLRRGQHQNQADRTGSGPAGLTDYSRRLTLLFFGLALGAALLSFLLLLLVRHGVTGLGNHLSGWAGALYAKLEVLVQRFLNWFWGLFTLAGPETGQKLTVDNDGVVPIPPVVTAVSTLMIVLLLVSGGAVFLGLGAVYILHRRPSRALPPELLDYEDQVEELERPKHRRKPLGRRAPRAKDYQGALRIRFAFQELLRQRRKEDPLSYTKTPNELRQPDRPTEAALIAAYNRIRYANAPATPQDLAAADQFLQSASKTR
jgi:hypothetical protein